MYRYFIWILIYMNLRRLQLKILSEDAKRIIVFTLELNQKQWPGETKALFDTIGINNLKIERLSFMPQISFAQIYLTNSFTLAFRKLDY